MKARVTRYRYSITWELEHHLPADAEVIRRIRAKGYKTVARHIGRSWVCLYQWLRPRGRISMAHEAVIATLEFVGMEYEFTPATLVVKEPTSVPDNH